MSLIMMEGFDHLTLAQLYAKKGWSGASHVLGAYGRFGTNGLNAYSSSAFVSYSFLGESTVYVGFAIRKSEATAPGIHNSFPWMAFYDDTGLDHVTLHITADNSIEVREGEGNTIIGTTSIPVLDNFVWVYVEIKITISDTVGVVEILKGEDTVLNLTNQDIQYGSNAYISRIMFGCIYGSIDAWWDDIYLDDAQFHGDCRVRTFLPDADGNSADLTRSAGSNDYECVDDNPSNDDTDYISSSTVNDKSIFGITTGALGTVKGIQVNNQVRVTEAGQRKITPIIRSNSVDYQGTETDPISAGYTIKNQMYETDPDDAAVWTQTKLEAAEFGLEITT